MIDPEIVHDLEECMNKKFRYVTAFGTDGRVDSHIQEDRVYKKFNKCLEKLGEQKDINFELQPKSYSRSPYDFKLHSGGKSIDCNIKVIDTTKSSSINAVSLQLLNYFLFDSRRTMSWEAMASKCCDPEKYPRKFRNYYYLIVSKNEGKTQLVSVAQLSENSLTSNPSNNLQLSVPVTVRDEPMTSEEAILFLIKKLEEVLTKRARPFFTYLGYDIDSETLVLTKDQKNILDLKKKD